MIADVHRLGILTDDMHILDPTYGMGVFWSVWKPPLLTACDINPTKSPLGSSVDFTALPWIAGSFDAVVLDGPYKLNGTSAEDGDERYGVEVKKRWQERHALIREGMTECARVLRPEGWLLVKGQDQVCSGAVRWQTREFADHGESLGMTLVDRFDMTGTSRPQDSRRKQVHAHGRPSSLLCFRFPKARKKK